MAKIEFTTENSVYVLDQENQTWERTGTSNASGQLRTESGTLWAYNTLEVGQSACLFGPPIADGAIVRLIKTSFVLHINGSPEQWECEEFPLR